jgi:phospholipid transport system substrate-binding protein
MKIRLILSVTLLLAIGTAQAQPGYYGNPAYYPPMPDYQQETPATLLEDGIKRIQVFIKQKGIKDPEVLTAFLNEQMAPYFDFDYMASLVGGRYYDQLDPPLKTQFKSRLQKMFFSALSRNLGAYTEPMPRIDFMRQPRIRSYNDVEVAARVLPANGYPIRLIFRFARTNDGWKVYDASYNGMSAVMYYRKYFMEQARRYGTRALLD